MLDFIETTKNRLYTYEAQLGKSDDTTKDGVEVEVIF
jgi:hypothetical protein